MADLRTTVLLRLSGELSTKARATRRHFVGRLVRNLKDLLSSEGILGEVERRHDRLLVHLEDPARAPELARIFGLQSLAVAESREVDSLATIVRHGEALFRDAVRGRRFAVRARTVGSSGAGGARGREVERELGTALLPGAAGVDLGNPELTARVELFEGRAYYFHENLPGEGGLPLGAEGRGVALVSGGFDSPVAAWQMLRRGVDLDYVFCNLGGRSHQLGTLRVMKVLADRWSYGRRPRLHAIDFATTTRELRARTEPRYWQVLLKRLMLRAAEQVARERGAQAIITGDAVGQVSSQTLVNLRAISDATTLPILRPLVGANKDEIIAMARHIGTEPLSAIVDEYCALVPGKPATAARLEVVQQLEAEMDLAILERAVHERQVQDLRALDPDDTGLPELETREVPPDARVIDLRTRAQYDQWHYPDALQLGWDQALLAYPSFSKDQPYVVYCEYGLKSAHLAELMRSAGLEAFHFRGGAPRLRKELASQLSSRVARPGASGGS